MAQAVFLAIDLGAESGRVLAGRLKTDSGAGARFELEELHRFANGPVSVAGHLYWDVLGIWSEIKRGLSLAVQKFGNQVVSVGADTWGVDYALLDGNDELVGTPYHYRHKRTEGMLEEAFRLVPRADIYRRSGIQFMRINTLYQLLSMAVQGSPQLGVAESFLMMPDLVHFWLCGEKFNEFTNATTTQFYDQVGGDWNRTLLERLGIPTRILKPVIPAGTKLGQLRAAVASELRASGSIVVVVPATHDTGSAVAATPLSSKTAAYISSGTWSLVGVELSEPVITDESLRYNFTNEGGAGGTTRLLRNVMGLWLVAECQRAWRTAGRESTYDDLINAARDARPFRCLVNPDDERFLAPPSMPGAISEFCRETGQPEPETEAEFVRCCLESLALKYRWVIERIEQLTGKTVDVIHVVGGGSKNWLLNQLTADATRRPVLAGPVEATATGNALMQAIGLGYLSSHAELRDVVRSSFELRSFEPKTDNRWEGAYERLNEWLS